LSPSCTGVDVGALEAGFSIDRNFQDVMTSKLKKFRLSPGLGYENKFIVALCKIKDAVCGSELSLFIAHIATENRF